MPNIDNISYHTFKPYHLNNYKGLKSYGISSMSDSTRKQGIERQSLLGPCVTVMHHNDVIAIFGVVLIWKGLGEAWSTFDEKARRYPIGMTKGALTFFDICEILFSLHRLQITVLSTDNRALRWANTIGFVQEGLLTQYSEDKKDFYMMRRKSNG